jgi:hypothetical protein
LKKDILKDIQKYDRALARRMGDNPDIGFGKDSGRIYIKNVNTGKVYPTELHPDMFLP